MKETILAILNQLPVLLTLLWAACWLRQQDKRIFKLEKKLEEAKNKYKGDW